MTLPEFFQLIAILSPTVEAPSDGDWVQFEAHSLLVPNDYKAFLMHFGTGVLAEFFYIWNPFSNAPSMNLLSQKERTLQTLQDLVADAPELYVHWKLYPNEAGLLPFGKTGNGDILFWNTTGPADLWRVAVSNGEPSIEYLQEGLISFLGSVLTVRGYCRQLPDLTTCPKEFLPLAKDELM